MPATIPDRPLLLTGMPGAGKTTVGRLAADAFGLPFVDTDAEVERSCGRTVAALWAEGGEQAFRAVEKEAVRAALDRPDRAVVALGGGALIDDDLRRWALDKAIVAWLQVPLPVLAARLAVRPRPVLGEGDPVAALERLMTARAAGYAEAHLHVPYLPGPPERTAEALAALIRKHVDTA